MTLAPGPRRGTVAAPVSKSHLHRLLIANFLAGSREGLAPAPGDSADVAATRRCLAALAEGTDTPELDCGESGSTLRFLAPVAAALGKRPHYLKAGRLAARPMRSYETIASGLHELPGDVSSQFVTGLLFALPLLPGDSEIRFASPLESRGYVDLTLQVVRAAGIAVEETSDGRFLVPGAQRFRAQATPAEGDWSGAAFWLAMNALGSDVSVTGLNDRSAQPDRVITRHLETLRAGGDAVIDVAPCPDIFPVLSVIATHGARRVRFTGTRRLRLKECDRAAAMEETLARFGAKTETGENEFVVRGLDGPFSGGAFRTFGDHRIAMSCAVGATLAAAPLTLDNAACAAKSYPDFFERFNRLKA